MRWVFNLVIIFPSFALACEGTIRVATAHVELSHKYAGQIAKDLLQNEDNVLGVRETIRTIDPDILLLTKVDIDAGGYIGELFAAFFDYPYVYTGPVNRGVPLSFDENRNSRKDANDHHGFASFYGQAGMVLLSRCEILNTHSFNNIKWSAIAETNPVLSGGTPYFTEDEWQEIRLASTAFWQVDIMFENTPISLLASYHTTPVFDGEENRNGLRNRDELAFWRTYISGETFLDDNEAPTALTSPFILLGNFNLDPENGEGEHHFMKNVLESGLVQDPQPQGPLGVATANWDNIGAGHMRVDYVLPSPSLRVIAAGQSQTPFREHFAVYVDIARTR